MQTLNFAILAAFIIFITCSEAVESEFSPIISETETELTDIVAEVDTTALNGIDSLAINLTFNPTEPYKTAKRDITGIWNKLHKTKPSLSDSVYLDSAGLLFTEVLLNKIVPHWYGTPWDFEGHTLVPNQGSVACGYFVSTTLNHMGINVNRYKLAQQGPKNEAISIAIDSELITTVEGANITKYLKQLKEGLYFIGLDNHVGYFLKRNGVDYFLHSNYIENKVMIEKVEDSQAFYSTEYFFANITYNQELMQKWLTKTEVIVFKG